jgi:flagellar biogenesis protein FliO
MIVMQRRYTSLWRNAVLGACLLADAWGSAWGQLAGGGTTIAIDPWRIVLSLAFCLAVGVAAILYINKRKPLLRWLKNDAAKRMSVIEVLPLAMRVNLVLVKVDGQDMVFSVDNAGAKLIAHLPAANSVTLPIPAHSDATSSV